MWDRQQREAQRERRNIGKERSANDERRGANDERRSTNDERKKLISGKRRSDVCEKKTMSAGRGISPTVVGPSVLQSLVQGIRQQGDIAAKKAERDKDVKLTKLTAEDNIEAYLTTLEHIMAAYEIPKERDGHTSWLHSWWGEHSKHILLCLGMMLITMNL